MVLPAHPLSRCSIAVAVAALCSGLSPAWSEVSITGSFNAGGYLLPIGPGSTDLGANTLALSGSGVGSLLVNNSSFLKASSIRFADDPMGVATGVFDGQSTLVELRGDGNTNRLELGIWGRGSLVVSGGATFDARANGADCQLGFKWCHNFIGNFAGGNALLTVTGADSNASFLRAFVVGGATAFKQSIEGFDYGTPGGTTRGRVEVLNGGKLTTDEARLA